LNTKEYPNWFQATAIDYFQLVMKNFRDVENLNFLQIGAYTGDCSKWLLDNVLTKQSSTLTDVDTWQGSDEAVHKKMDFSDIEKVYDNKVSKYNNVIKYKGTSESFLTTAKKDSFDFIYIDGDHAADAVYKDALLSFKALKVGGIMAFDDYHWEHDSKNPKLEPKMGIDKFIQEHSGKIFVYIVLNQVWLSKENN
jgi:hypothetical protein